MGLDIDVDTDCYFYEAIGVLPYSLRESLEPLIPILDWM